jgi:hypothetical protein
MKSKWPCFILALYLVIALTGAFTLSAAETIRYFEIKNNLPDSSGFLTTVTHTADCLAENTVIINRAGRCSSSTLCNGWQRIFLPSGIQSTGTYLTCISLQTADEYLVTIPKNIIPLKLRI